MPYNCIYHASRLHPAIAKHTILSPVSSLCLCLRLRLRLRLRPRPRLPSRTKSKSRVSQSPVPHL